jgi:type 1 glutamine amidotransferase
MRDLVVAALSPRLENAMLRCLLTSLLVFSALSETTAAEPIRALIITGDNVGAHDWKATTAALKEILAAPEGRFTVDVADAPAKQLTAENLAKYDVLILNYFETAKGGPDTKWSDANKQALLDAVKGGKGLVSYHFASAAFARPNWEEYEKLTAGGWRTQGFHGPPHEFEVKKAADHPIAAGAPAKFAHTTDELYSNSLITPDSIVIATAWCDPAKPKGTGKDEPVIWVNQYGKGLVYNNVLGHDPKAMANENYREWFRRGVEWAATGKIQDKK